MCKLQKKLDAHWKFVRKHAKKTKKYFSMPIPHPKEGMADFWAVRDIRKYY